MSRKKIIQLLKCRLCTQPSGIISPLDILFIDPPVMKGQLEKLPLKRGAKKVRHPVRASKTCVQLSDSMLQVCSIFFERHTLGSIASPSRNVCKEQWVLDNSRSGSWPGYIPVNNSIALISHMLQVLGGALDLPRQSFTAYDNVPLIQISMPDHKTPIVRIGYKFVNLRSAIEIMDWFSPGRSPMERATESPVGLIQEPFPVCYSAFCGWFVLALLHTHPILEIQLTRIIDI